MDRGKQLNAKKTKIMQFEKIMVGDEVSLQFELFIVLNVGMYHTTEFKAMNECKDRLDADFTSM